ncbi:MAG TPA: dihydrofolate reductase family protein [Solirubrobacterales bacterium]
MAKLIYAAIASLDLYVEDEDGGFGWAKPGEELHAFVNDLERQLGTYLYGRRMYETMVAWETIDDVPDQPAVIRDYAEVWRAAEKVVYSGTLEEAASARTRIEREFDPVAVKQLVESAERDVGVGGPGLAASALEAGLVDEVHLFLHPVVIGGGKPALPKGQRLELELVGQGRFDDGVVHLHYRAKH